MPGEGGGDNPYSSSGYYPSEMLDPYIYYVDTVPDYLIQGHPPSEEARRAKMRRKLERLQRKIAQSGGGNQGGGAAGGQGQG